MNCEVRRRKQLQSVSCRGPSSTQQSVRYSQSCSFSMIPSVQVHPRKMVAAPHSQSRGGGGSTSDNTSNRNRMESQGARLLLDLFLFLLTSVYYVLEACVLTLLPLRFRCDPDRLRGQVALVTGGAGGVGRFLCVKLAQRGTTVVVWDVNAEGIKETVKAVQAAGGKAVGYVCDLSSRASIYETAEKVKKEVGKVDIVVNNAAMLNCKLMLDIEDEKIERTFDVNILAHFWMAKAFLPEMISSQRGHIVTVASVTGILGTYKCSDYSATKFAACGFHEVLYTELQVEKKTGVDCTLVCPYHINTPMFQGVKPRLRPCLEPEYVAEKIVLAILKKENFVILPNILRWFFPVKFFLPAKMCWSLMYNVLQTPQAMMKFNGHEEKSKIN
ncbi:Hypothetical predicted protein [Cloeon dipterum]|nr:Hypothetical predicted protein [Cloeon dipterum]